MSNVQALFQMLQLYESSREETIYLKQVKHDDLVNATNQFLFHHGPRFGIRSWSDLTQGLRDSGVDGVWRYSAGSEHKKLGIQIKSWSDFNKESSFRQNVMAQIAESRQYELSHLLIGLAADLNNSSHREKARGVIADFERMTDHYVVPISPEKITGLWKWYEGLNVDPIEQMRSAGYAWLTATFDSLRNLNRRSWGKGTGGDWSDLRCGTIYSGDSITIHAIGNSEAVAPLEYQFSLQRSGGCFEVRQEWSEKDTWTWAVEQADIGRHITLMVAVRIVKDYYQFSNCDDYNYATYDVLPAAAR